MVSTVSNILKKPILKRAIKFFLSAISITTLMTIVTYLINPDLKEVIGEMDTNSSDQLTESTGIKKVWLYVVNNGFAVPFQMFILSLIPIQFLYYVNIIISASLPGILFGVAFQDNLGKGFEIIIAATPHYVLEFFAFSLFAATLFKLNQVVRAEIRNIFKKDKIKVSLVRSFLSTVKIYTIFVLPIIIVAAFLETYIADIIFNLFR